MPRKAKALTPSQISKLKPPAAGMRRVSVGGVAGLEVQLTSGGGRSWILRGVSNGRRVNRGLGSLDDVSLAEARETARQYRKGWREGRDLAEERQRAAQQAAREAQRRITFGEFRAGAIEALTASLTNDKARKQWGSTIEAYAVPVIGDIPVADITVSDIAAVLSPIWHDKHVTASRLRGRLERVIDRAVALELRTAANPARRGPVEAVLGAPRRTVTLRPAVD